MITQAELKEILHYAPDTGEFTWLIKTGPRSVIGSIAGSLDAYGYRCIKLHGKNYKSHRLVWLYHTGEMPISELDHRNQKKADNRIENLRVATRSENVQNTPTRVDNTSGHRGVVWNKHNKNWVAQANVSGVRKFLKASIYKEVAIAAYEAFAKAEFKDFYNPGTV